MNDEANTTSDSDLKGEVKQVSNEVSVTAKEKVVDLTQEAGEQARHLIEEARESTRRRLEQEGEQVSQTARQWAEDLRQMAEASPDNPMAGLAREGADRIEQLVSRYDETGLDGLTNDVTRFARRRPMVFLGGAFAVGVVAARLFRHADTESLEQTVAGEGQPQGQANRQQSQSATGAKATSGGSSGAADRSRQPTQQAHTARDDV